MLQQKGDQVGDVFEDDVFFHVVFFYSSRFVAYLFQVEKEAVQQWKQQDVPSLAQRKSVFLMFCIFCVAVKDSQKGRAEAVCLYKEGQG
ncbi:MAG: hypothetical protein D3916_00830 [Candidatus Electrothrix sp. MAN1_4]|nr:hypothetical protein [Candidatus Electrothrix sp. MAN1_4]